MSAYYNEIDKHAAAWTRQLIKMNLIMDGEVDERSITEVVPSDLKGFTRCHFFSGLAGWDYALQLAGWDSTRPVWTGSAPCQSFSVAGKGKGKDDERHLWPELYRLISQCRPDCVLGEQVESAVKHGWLCDLQADLEREGYAVGVAVLGAHSVSAPHIRQRLYWVANRLADESGKRFQKRIGQRTPVSKKAGHDAGEELERSSGLCGGVVYADGAGSKPRREFAEAAGYGDTVKPAGGISGVADAEHAKRGTGNNGRAITDREKRERDEGADSFGEYSFLNEWDDPDWLYCRDNKWRAIRKGLKPLVGKFESGAFEMVDGLPGKLVQSRDSSLSKHETNQEKEIIDGLPFLRGKIDSPHSTGSMGINVQFQSPKILQCDMQIRSKEKVVIAGYGSQQGKSAQNGERTMRDLQHPVSGALLSRTPHRRESVQQLTGKSDDTLRELPHENSLDELRPSNNETEALPVLPEASENSRSMRVTRELCEIGETNTIDSAPIHADATQEARVMRLKGYGNSICIPVAVEFIKAFMAVG